MIKSAYGFRCFMQNICFPSRVCCMILFFSWASIIKAAEILKDGFIIRIGKGEVSLWYDKWLEFGYLSKEVDYINIMDTALQVKGGCNEAGWNFVMPQPFRMMSNKL